MRKVVGIIGAGGLIGSALCAHLSEIYDIRIIKSNNLYLRQEELSLHLQGLDVVINLAGYPIAGRWSKKIKKKIYNSRIETTKNLIRAVNLLKVKPTHYLNASAVGIYADGVACDEDSSHLANNFLAGLVKDWEQEVYGIKDVNFSIVRIGVVLSRDGGAYPMLRSVFNFGIGGPIGSGNQGFSYILINDLVRIFELLIKNDIYGVVNAVAPFPTTNREFSFELARILKRPVIFTLPELFVKLLYGEGSITVLEGQKVVPKRLTELEFNFVGDTLSSSLTLLES